MAQAKTKKLSVLDKNGKFNSTAFDEEVKIKLKKIIDKKDLKDIQKFIATEIENSVQDVNFNYKFKCFAEDGAYALHTAIQNLFGYSSQKGKGPSNNPPDTIDVVFADGTRTKVPWGAISIPSLGDGSEVNMGYDAGSRTFQVSGTCQRRYQPLMDDIMSEVQRILDEESIYRGKAIRLDSDLHPTFIDLSNIKNTPLYLTESTKFSLQPILSRIEKPEVCEKNGLDLKFGALLEGEYGTGKTLLAWNLAYKAIQNDWSFIYLTDPTKTTEMLKIASDLCSNGNGVVVFVEDIDQVLRGERDTEMNEILNLIDGGDTKNNNIISIFTTNHLEMIDPTFLRGKRTGSLISMTALDKETALEFIKGELGEQKIEGDVDEAAEKVAALGIVPAFLAEILDRVKTNMVYTESDTVTSQDIMASIESYKSQIEIAKVKSLDKSKEEEFVGLFKELCVEGGMTDTLRKMDLI